MTTALRVRGLRKNYGAAEAFVGVDLVRVFGKLGVDDRTAAVTRAMAQGLL